MSITARMAGGTSLQARVSGSTGAPGEDGATFTPSVSEDGTLSWSNDKELDNPAPVNIKGPQGPKGEPGASGVYILANGETVEDAPEDTEVVIDPNGEGVSTLSNPHALTFTGAVSATYDGSEAVEVELPDTYSKNQIDAIMGAYIADIDTLIGGDA